MEGIITVDLAPTPEMAAENIGSSINPVPMSFPAILRSSKLADRYSLLRDGLVPHRSQSEATLSSKKRSRDDREGKRWVRRRENARFTDNPYVVQPLSQDIQVNPPSTRRTFPEPLPPFLPRSVSAPAASLPVVNTTSANMGRYSMSLKGMRRTLRGHGPRAQILVRDIENDIIGWLSGEAILLPDETGDILLIRGRHIGDTLTITELLRTPLQLIWSIEQDAFARYIVHCCARYHRIVSYSKDVDGRRLTYLLRPNITRQDYTARHVLETPPATESDYSLSVLSESDIISVEDNDATSDSLSDNDLPRRIERHRRLSSVSEKASESEIEATPRPARLRQASYAEDLTAEADADDDQSIVNVELAQSVDSLDLNPSSREPPIRFSSPLTERTPLRDRRGVSRTSSSPSHSRSPHPSTRRNLRNGRKRLARRQVHDSKQSFYDYLYS